MDATMFNALREAIETENPAVLATVIAGPTTGSELLLTHPDTWLGSLGTPDLDANLRETMLALQRDGGATTKDVGNSRVYLETHLPPPHLVIIGGVHIAIPLVTYATTLGYHTTVIDARGQFLTEERFAHAERRIEAWPDEALNQINLHPGVAAVCLAHDAKFEDPAMDVLLRSHVGYIGAVGSRKTSAERRERLIASGFSAEQVDRIHGPVGLNIGAKTPEEIALSIMAEIIAVRRGKDPKTVAAMPAKSTV